MLQPYVSARTLFRELQLFSSWRIFNGFRKQVTMKFKKKKISRHNTLNYVQHSKQILMIMAGDDKEGVTVSSVMMVDVTARDIMRNT